MERRNFIRLIGTVGSAFLILPQLVSCSEKRKSISTKILGANKKRGHLLRDNKLSNLQTVKKIEIDTIIVGGGITGLSCAYHLAKNNYTDFLLLEMNERTGGNSDSGENEFSKFPLGAHYLTLPNPQNRTLIEFLKENQLLTKENKDGTQEYSEEHLCHAPDERLLHRGVFQEGFVPSYGVPEKQNEEIIRFFLLMEEMKKEKGSDGKFLFDIPLTSASKDTKLLDYDKISFEQYLHDNNFNSDELNWFLDYCCRDDFGAGLDRVSAWSGINYFAGRKSNPSNTIPSNVLTWPEGNGFLVDILKEKSKNQIRTGIAVTKIEEYESHSMIIAFDFSKNENILIKAKKVIVSSPSYVTKHILKSNYWNESDFENYIHHPWLVSIVVLDKIPVGSGLDLAWDNVKFGTKGLGYINNQHQEFNQHKDKHVISVYLAFDKEGDVKERQKMFSLTEEEMKQLVLQELNGIHPTIEEHIESISFQQWGHGMVTPYPNSLATHYDFIEKNGKSPIIRLAHTDYSGYSIFEEGFSQGIESANFIIKNS